MFSYLITNGADEYRYLEFLVNLDLKRMYFWILYKSLPSLREFPPVFDYRHMLFSSEATGTNIIASESDVPDFIEKIFSKIMSGRILMDTKDIGYLTPEICLDINKKFRKFYQSHRKGHAAHSHNPLYDIGYSPKPLTAGCDIDENKLPEVHISCPSTEDIDYYLENGNFSFVTRIKRPLAPTRAIPEPSMLYQYWWLAVLPVGLAYFLYTKCKKGKAPSDPAFLKHTLIKNVLNEYIEAVDLQIRTIPRRTDMNVSAFNAFKAKFKKETEISLQEKLEKIWKSNSPTKFRELCDKKAKEIIPEIITTFKKQLKVYTPAPTTFRVDDKKTETETTKFPLTDYLKVKTSLIEKCEEYTEKLEVLRQLHKNIKVLNKDAPEPSILKLKTSDNENPAQIQRVITIDQQSTFETANLSHLQKIEAYSQIVESKLQNLEISIKKHEKTLEKLKANEDKKPYVHPTRALRLVTTPPKEKKLAPEKSSTAKIQTLKKPTVAKVSPPTRESKREEEKFEFKKIDHNPVQHNTIQPQNIKNVLQRANRLITKINIPIDKMTDEKEAELLLAKKFSESKISFADKVALKLALESVFIDFCINAPIGRERHNQRKFRNTALYKKFNGENIFLMSVVKTGSYDEFNHRKVLTFLAEMLIGLYEYTHLIHPTGYLQHEDKTPHSKILAESTEPTLNPDDIFSLFSENPLKAHGDYCDCFQELLFSGIIRNSQWLEEKDKPFVESYAFLRMISDSVKSDGSYTHEQRRLANQWRHGKKLRDEITKTVMADETFIVLTSKDSINFSRKNNF